MTAYDAINNGLDGMARLLLGIFTTLAVAALGVCVIERTGRYRDAILAVWMVSCCAACVVWIGNGARLP